MSHISVYSANYMGQTNSTKWGRRMGKTKPVWFGMKVTPDQKRKIRRLAEREGTSAKEAVMRLVENALADEDFEAPEGSFLSGIEDLIGSIEGPPDLASNPSYMEGFGRHDR